MDTLVSVRCLAWEWAAYLRERGHRVAFADDWCMLRSRNGQGIRYRWLLLCARKPTRRLTISERETVQAQLLRGKRARERVYVVLGFHIHDGRLLVVPAARALQEPRLKTSVGGIPWEW